KANKAVNKTKKEKPKIKKKAQKPKKKKPAPKPQKAALVALSVEAPQEALREEAHLMSESKIRRSALEVKKVVEEEERELLEKESIWETPAILRRKEK
ncbi:MAG: hypothetical protein Q8N69_02165, partial [bacterium]|nr:hypothetical protein [bacterium]